MNIFKNKNFLMLTMARLIINFADSLFYIVCIWYTSKILGSALYTSIAVFLFMLPEILSFFTGPIIDRVNPKKILLFSLASQLLLLIVLIGLFNYINIYILLIIMFLSAFMSNITYPIEDTMIPQIVSTDELVAANSVVTITYKIFDSFFNGISGFMLAAFTTVNLFKIDIIVFSIPVIIISLMRFAYTRGGEDYSINEYFQDLKGGVVFIKDSPILTILLPLILVNFFNSSNEVVLPFFCQQYEKAPEVYGMILALKGVGGVLGAILINYVKKFLPTGKLLSFLLICNGMLWICFIFIGNLCIGYIFVFFTYIFYGMYNIIYGVLFQAITPVDMLGRVTTGIDTTITIAMPMGALFGGWIVKLMPYNLAMIFSGISVIATGIIYLRNKAVNNLDYVDKLEKIQL